MKKTAEFFRDIFGNGSYATRMYVNRGRFWFACKDSYKFSQSRGELKTIGPGSILRSLLSQNNTESEMANVLALQFNEETRHGVIDIDVGSKYKNEDFINKFYSVCDDMGVKAIRIISSKSGGWHLIVTFDKMIKSLVVYKLLASIAYLSGVKSVVNGQFEIYPNPKNRTQKVRLPGQIEQYLIDMNFDVSLDECVGFNFTAMDHKEKMNTLDKIFNSNTFNNNRECIEKIVREKISLNRLYLFGKKNEIVVINEISETEDQFNKRTSSRKFENKLLVKFCKDEVMPEIKLNKDIVKNYNAKRDEAANFFNDLGYSGVNLFNRGVDYYRDGLTEFGTRLDALISIGYALYFSGYNSTERELILSRWMSLKNNDRSKDWLRRPDFVTSQIRKLTHWGKSIENPQSTYENFKSMELLSKEECISIKKIAFEKKCAKQMQNNRLMRAMNVSKIYYASLNLHKNGYKVSIANIMKVTDVGRATIYRVRDSFNLGGFEEFIKSRSMVKFINDYDNEIDLRLYKKEIVDIINKRIEDKMCELTTT